MSKFILLHSNHATPIPTYVNTSYICMITSERDGSMIELSTGKSESYIETPEEIIKQL